MDLVVLGFPFAGRFHVLQEFYKTRSIVAFRHIELEDVPVLFRVAFEEIDVQRRCVAVQVRDARWRRDIHCWRWDDGKCGRNRVAAAFDQRLKSCDVAFWRQHIEVDDLCFQLTAKNAAGGVDILNRHLNAVGPVLVVCNADRA